MNVSGGHIVGGPDEHIIRTFGEFRSVEEIGDAIVAVRGGNSITVNDLATVVDGHQELRGHIKLNGEAAVLFAVMKQPGANTVKVADAVQKVISGLDPPAGVKFLPVMDQAEFIRKIVNMTVKDALYGGVLAVLFILIFLRNLRPTLVIFLAIPLSILTTFIGFYFAGYTFNLITLMGLGLGVGMLVDNAVVVIENMYRHMELGEERKVAASRGATEVMTAITASTLTTITVFLPMVLIEGLMSKFARPLALTLTLALLASLFVAVSLVPMLASLIFKPRTQEQTERARRGGIVVRAYRKAVTGAVDNPWLVLGLVGAALGLAALVAVDIPREFMPSGDDPMFPITVKLPVGTPLEDADRVISDAAAYVESLPETQFAMVQTGPASALVRQQRGSMGMSVRDVNEGLMFVRLSDLDDRMKQGLRRSDAVKEDLRRNFPRTGDSSPFYVAESQSGMVSTHGSDAPFTLRIYGDELPVLKELGNVALQRLSGVGGLRELRLSLEEGKPEVRFVPDRVRASQWGLGTAQIGTVVRTAMLGEVATRARLSGDDIDVRVVLREKDRKNMDALLNLPILTPLGVCVPLGSVAKVTYPRGPLQITREGRRRHVTVAGELAGRALGDVIKDAQKAVKDMDLPPGYLLEFGGSYKDMVETLTQIGLAFIAAAILVYMVMAALFESLSQPLVVMITVPLAGIGVVVGLRSFGMSLSLVSGLGLVILVGIVVNNAIVMIDRINQLRASGTELRQAVIEGATGRLRPVLITSFTTILGVLPMALSRSEGAQMRSPMGVAVSFGLFFSMFLTLFVIPTVYARSCVWADSAAALFAWIVRGEKSESGG